MALPPIKQLYLPSSMEARLKENEFHTIFSLPQFEKNNESKVNVADIIQICLAYEDGYAKAYGLGEVVAVKECLLEVIDAADIERAPSIIRGKRDVQRILQKSYPEYRADIHGRTSVTVATIRRFDYDINKIKTRTQKKMVPKPQQM